MIHLPIHTWPASPRLFRSVYATRHTFSDVLAHLKRTLVVAGSPVRLMRGISYELRWLYSELALIGFSDMMFATKSNGDLHPFVFGRKPA